VVKTLVAEIPGITLLPCVKIEPADPKTAFTFWLVPCLALGYLEVAWYAFVGTLTSGSDFFVLAPMYALKLVFDLIVCTALTYLLYFVMVKTTNKLWQQIAMGFLGVVILKTALMGFLAFSLIALTSALANAVLLARAWVVYSSPTYVPLEEETPNGADTPLDGEGAAFPDPPGSKLPAPTVLPPPGSVAE